MHRRDPGDRANGPGAWPPAFKELMTVSIIHALLRCTLAVFGPGTGRRRAGACPAAAAPGRVPEGRPGPMVVPLPTARSPYGLPVLLDGARTAPIRPYVLAAERAA